MSDVVLLYPYINPANDKSIFRFPPLGLGYIASYLRKHQVSVEIVDCTFKKEQDALQRVKALNPSIIGIYSMFSMKSRSIIFAKLLRDSCELMIAGGPLPTLHPETFLNDFDVVVIGEGEQTMLEVVNAFFSGEDVFKIDGIAYRKSGHVADYGSHKHDKNFEIVRNPARKPISHLDSIPFPARELFDNQAYKDYYKKDHGYTTTSIITSRGCPFNCDFCSQPIFGNLYRARSAENVVNEVEDVLSLGYEEVFFVDDCFTLSKRRVTRICDEIKHRGIDFQWECLSRVDSIDAEIVSKMKHAGCKRIFFGIESGNNAVLKIMNKMITLEQARKAVETVASAGIKTGAFFIVGYPGETNETILDTIRFSTSLPLDYLSFTFPYPIPGTGLHRKVKGNIRKLEFNPPTNKLVDHELLFQSSFSEKKLKFAVVKAMIQFRLRKSLGKFLYTGLGKPFELLTDGVFKLLR